MNTNPNFMLIAFQFKLSSFMNLNILLYRKDITSVLYIENVLGQLRKRRGWLIFLGEQYEDVWLIFVKNNTKFNK